MLIVIRQNQTYMLYLATNIQEVLVYISGLYFKTSKYSMFLSFETDPVVIRSPRRKYPESVLLWI